MEFTIDLKNYPENGSVFRRTAARGVICRGTEYLLILSKYGDCKFPGGGLEDGESPEEALVREVREETGYAVRRESIRSLGTVWERRKGDAADIMEMDSHYYFCEVENLSGEQDLDDYEAEYEYRAVWMPLEEALAKNRLVSDLEACPWVKRDSKVMEYLLEAGIPTLATRSALIGFCQNLGSDVVEDYPFQDGNWTVMRHRGNKKGFAFLYEHHGGLQVNVKCSPEWTAFWRNAFDGVIPGYHMNKTHWNTILLNGSVPDQEIKAMIAESYRLTEPVLKGRTKK